MSLRTFQYLTYLLLLAGLVSAGLGYYRVGGFSLALAVGAVFVWRLVGPKGRLEFFSVRSRWIDLVTIGLLFGTLIFLSVIAR
ncbi:MAG: hypothetical protein RJA41_116 [Actinomycetota bacterium]|jgi:hypothetical protein